MADGIKFSEFPEVDSLHADSSFPILSKEENKRINFDSLANLLLEQIKINNENSDDNSYIDIDPYWNNKTSDRYKDRKADFMRKGNLVQFTVEFEYIRDRSTESQDVFSGIPAKYRAAADVYFAVVSDKEYLESHDEDEWTVISIEPVRLQITTDGKLKIDASGAILRSKIRASGVYFA